MNYITLVALAVWAPFVAAAAAGAAETESPAEQASYGIGYTMGEQLKGQNLPEISVDAVIEGITDSLEGRPRKLDDAALKAAFDYLRERQSEQHAQLAKANLEQGKAFLAKNGAREGVTTTASGLQYEVLRGGDGPKPSASDRVKTHYRGELIDGTVFDSSYDRGQPVTFGVNQVISGWTEALQLMPVGAKWRIFIPSDLAYGEKGAAGGRIPPNSVLVFDVELLEINPTE